VSFLRCVLSGRALWSGPVTRPEECYRLCVCDPETSAMEKSEPTRAVEVLNKICNSDITSNVLMIIHNEW